MCESKPSPEMTTRFVVSVEQMVPYLEHLCKVVDDDDEDNGIDDNFIENVTEQPLNPIEENVPNIPQVDETVNYIDISMLNPIVEAYACLQKDQLNEEGMYVFKCGITKVDCIIIVIMYKGIMHKITFDCMPH